MSTTFEHLKRCSLTLERSVESLSRTKSPSVDYEVFRNAVIKSFELTLETAGRLLRKVLKEYAGSPAAVDALVFKDVLRHAALHGLLSVEELERWMRYRDSRNETAHNYGEEFAEHTLRIITDFQRDAMSLFVRLTNKHG